MNNEQYLTAIHESGHYIALLKYFGDNESFRPLKISIVPNHLENYLGVIKTSDASLRTEPSIEKLELFIEFWLAGYAAEYVYEEKEDISEFLDSLLGEYYLENGSDLHKSLDAILYHKKSTNEKLSDLLLPYFEKVIVDLKANWQNVQYVSNLLMEKQEIEETGLQEITKQVLPQLK